MDNDRGESVPHLAGRDLDLLMAFRAVAEAGGITAAEHRLGLERSVISRQIKSLETRLGGRLCQRGPQGFELTELGNAALREAAAVHDLFDQLNTRLGRAGRAVGGAITLGVADNCMTNTAARLPDLLRAFVEAAPHCRFALKVMAPAQITEALRARALDVALTGEPHGDSDLSFAPLFEEEFRLYVSLGEGEAPIPLNELGAHGYGIVVREAERSPCAARTLPLDLSPRVNASGLEAVVLLLQTGRFVGLLPTHLATSLEGLGTFKEVPGARHLSVATQFGFVSVKGRYPSPAVVRLFEVARTVY